MHLSAVSVGVLALFSAGAAFALSPESFVGRPTQFKAGTVSGAAVWRDGDTFKVRFSASGEERHYRGKVCSREGIELLEVVGTSQGDSAQLTPEGKCISFKLTVGASIEGFDFATPKEVIIFDLREGHKQLSTERVWIGSRGVHPANTPFSLTLP
jgi:hypothetical protein